MPKLTTKGPQELFENIFGKQYPNNAAITLSPDRLAELKQLLHDGFAKVTKRKSYGPVKKRADLIIILRYGLDGVEYSLNETARRISSDIGKAPPYSRTLIQHVEAWAMLYLRGDYMGLRLTQLLRNAIEDERKSHLGPK